MASNLKISCAITRNIRQANHILAMYMIIALLKNKFILKSTKIVPRIDYKEGYSYHVSNQPKVSALFLIGNSHPIALFLIVNPHPIALFYG